MIDVFISVYPTPLLANRRQPNIYVYDDAVLFFATYASNATASGFQCQAFLSISNGIAR